MVVFGAESGQLSNATQGSLVGEGRSGAQQAQPQRASDSGSEDNCDCLRTNDTNAPSEDGNGANTDAANALLTSLDVIMGLMESRRGGPLPLSAPQIRQPGPSCSRATVSDSQRVCPEDLDLFRELGMQDREPEPRQLAQSEPDRQPAEALERKYPRDGQQPDARVRDAPSMRVQAESLPSNPHAAPCTPLSQPIIMALSNARGSGASAGRHTEHGHEAVAPTLPPPPVVGLAGRRHSVCVPGWVQRADGAPARSPSGEIGLAPVADRSCSVLAMCSESQPYSRIVGTGTGSLVPPLASSGPTPSSRASRMLAFAQSLATAPRAAAAAAMAGGASAAGQRRLQRRAIQEAMVPKAEAASSVESAEKQWHVDIAKADAASPPPTVSSGAPAQHPESKKASVCMMPRPKVALGLALEQRSSNRSCYSGSMRAVEDAAAEAGAEVWHEVMAVGATDPADGCRLVVLMQRDVSAKVAAERHVALVSETEHRLLEQLFPRHVLQYITEEVGPPSSSPAAAARARGMAPGNTLESWRPHVRDCDRLATSHEQVTILFADIQGFTPMCKVLPARVVMAFLNDLFSRFDAMLDEHGVYKVETIGDCYMVAGGLISQDRDGMAAVARGEEEADHATRVVAFAKAMLAAASCVRLPTSGEPVRLRVGVHSGPVVSGVVGTRMPRFCLFGDTVNTASRMESSGVPGCIHVSADTYGMLAAAEGHDAAAREGVAELLLLGWKPTGGIEVKGKGLMRTFLYTPATPELCVQASVGVLPRAVDPATTSSAEAALGFVTAGTAPAPASAHNYFAGTSTVAAAAWRHELPAPVGAGKDSGSNVPSAASDDATEGPTLTFTMPRIMLEPATAQPGAPHQQPGQLRSGACQQQPPWHSSDVHGPGSCAHGAQAASRPPTPAACLIAGPDGQAPKGCIAQSEDAHAAPASLTLPSVRLVAYAAASFGGSAAAAAAAAAWPAAPPAGPAPARREAPDSGTVSGSWLLRTYGSTYMSTNVLSDMYGSVDAPPSANAGAAVNAAAGGRAAMGQLNLADSSVGSSGRSTAAAAAGLGRLGAGGGRAYSGGIAAADGNRAVLLSHIRRRAIMFDGAAAKADGAADAGYGGGGGGVMRRIGSSPSMSAAAQDSCGTHGISYASPFSGASSGAFVGRFTMAQVDSGMIGGVALAAVPASERTPGADTAPAAADVNAWCATGRGPRPGVSEMRACM